MTTEPMTDSPETNDRTDVPAGLELRPYRGEPDLAAMVRIFTAANEVDGIEERVSIEGLRNWVDHPTPHFDPAADIVLALVDGEPVGYGWTSWVDTTDGLREYATRGHVHPPWRRRRVGTAILGHNEARLRRLSAGHDSERPRAFTAFAPERRPGAVALLLGAGYQPVRYFFDMVRPTLDDIAVPDLPDSGRRLVHHLGDLVVRRLEYLTQDEHGPLGRAEGLQHGQKGDRHALSELDVLSHIGRS